MPVAELCWQLCEEGQGEELSANLTSRILDALRGPEGLRQARSSTDCSSGLPLQARLPCAFRGWVELRGELHEALDLLFEERAPLPRCLSELRIGTPGGAAAEGPPKARRRRPRFPELIFGLLNPQAAAPTAPRQRREAQHALRGVLAEHFALRPRSAEAVNLDHLLPIVGPLVFLDLLPLLLQQHRQQVEQRGQQEEAEQNHSYLQQLRTRLSPASLGALLRQLCEAQGPLLFEAPKIFAACWAAEAPLRRQQMSLAEAVEALRLPLNGTGVSWRLLLDVAQRRQSEAFLLHLFRCMDSSCLKKAAAAALAEKHPLTGQLLEPWGFMMSRTIEQEQAAEADGGCVAAAPAGHVRPSAAHPAADRWSSSPLQGDSRAHTSSCQDQQAETAPCAAEGKISSSSSFDYALPPSAIRFVGSASEIGECFELLRAKQQQQTRLISTETELQSLVADGGGLPTHASPQRPLFKVARHHRLQLQTLQQDSALGGPNGDPFSQDWSGEVGGGASCRDSLTQQESASSWASKGAPYGMFRFPLEMGEECGCAALLPLAWLLPNPLIVKVLFDCGDTLQKLAHGPLLTQEGPLGPLVHGIDLRQPRIYKIVRAPQEQPGPLLRDAQLTEALTSGNEDLLREVLRQKQHQQQPRQQGLETETEVLTIGTRRTLNSLARVVLGAPPSRGRCLSSTGGPNRRPLSAQVLEAAANETFFLLLIERALRRQGLLPKTILGGSGVHALLFDETAHPNAWRVDTKKSAEFARRRLREAMEGPRT
ncbi:hypothetical protein Efla_001205 [Eimeria flavescens]